MIFDFFNTYSTTISIFFIGIFSAYFGSFSSGWVSVLWVGFLTLLGISPQMASITFKLGKIGDVLGGVFLFHKNGHIPYRFLARWAIGSILWSFIGSYIIFSIPDRVIYLVSALSMLILAWISLHKKVGLKPIWNISRKREYSYYLLLFLVTMVGNIFIAGSWIWYYFLNTFVLRLSSMEAKGFATAMTIFWFIGTCAGILVQWKYNMPWGISLGVGMLIGWYFGTKHVIKIGNNALRYILLFTIVLFAFYFLYLVMR